MPLNIVVNHEEDNIAVIELEGDLVVADVDKLRREVKDLINKKIVKIVIDFSGVNFIDSSGIGLLVEFLKTLGKYEDGKLKLANLGKYVKEVLKQIQLYSIFEIYESVDEALEAMD